MKLNIFYSWESDLPNNKNRSLIEDCIKNATKNVFEKQKIVSEYVIESDSRNELGTPDLVSNIFNKIDTCDIFIADISIINSNDRISSNTRLSPNPNVLIELGYASKSIGWTNIICIYNTEFAKIEELPFDIRFRKPLSYDSSIDRPDAKRKLIKLIELSITDIIENRLVDKNEYKITKRQVDLGLQAILIDFCKLLYNDLNPADKYNYVKLLNSSKEDIFQLVSEKKFLGFHLFGNSMINIDEFTKFFNDGVDTYFLAEKEKRLIAKIIYALRSYKKNLMNEDILVFDGISTEYRIVSGAGMNPENPKDKYLLLKPIDDKRSIVISSGEILPEDLKKTLNIYIIREDFICSFSDSIKNIVEIINDWIKLTGNYFIENIR